VGPRNHVLDGDARWRQLANTMNRCCGTRDEFSGYYYHYCSIAFSFFAVGIPSVAGNHQALRHCQQAPTTQLPDRLALIGRPWGARAAGPDICPFPDIRAPWFGLRVRVNEGSLHMNELN